MELNLRLFNVGANLMFAREHNEINQNQQTR
jgi:hypothetical protein